MTKIFTNNGFKAPRFNEALEIIQEQQKATIPTKFIYQPDKIIYQLNAVVARMFDLVAQGAEAGFDSLKMGAAEGPQLEELARLRRVYRIPAGRSNTASQYAIMQPGKTIPAGSLFKSSVSDIRVYNPNVVSANPASCTQAVLQTNSNIIVGAVYSIVVNGDVYSYTALVGDDVADVHAAIGALMTADTNKTFTFTDTVQGSTRIFTITADTTPTISVSSGTTEIKITQVKVYFYAEAVETGAKLIEAGFIDSLVTPLLGVISTSNDSSYLLGREEETDVELRRRAASGPLTAGAGTIPAIEQRILTNVPNVTLARVIENTETPPVDAEGRPIYSFELLVDGGFLEEDLVEELWEVKPAGVPTHGTITATVLDSGGVARVVKYSRPATVDIEVEVDYEIYNEEDNIVDRELLIKEAILEAINSLSLGKDVIVGRLFAPVYAKVPSGLGSLVIRAKNKTVPGFTTNKVAIGATSYARIVIGDVVVTNVTP